jgi:hypothetical protein
MADLSPSTLTQVTRHDWQIMPCAHGTLVLRAAFIRRPVVYMYLNLMPHLT